MTGKFFFFALIGVCLVQGAEDFIEEGLARAQELNENGVRRIADTVGEVSQTLNHIQIDSVGFIKKSAGVQAEVRKTLGEEAAAMEEKARESQKPESAFQCIRVAQENANNRVLYLTNKFKTDLNRLQIVKLSNIRTTSRPLYGKREALRVRYQRVVKQVEGCGASGCVETAVNSFETWLNLMISDIERILGQVGKVYSNFNFDANNYFDNSFKQIDAIKSSTVRNIRQCV